MSRRLDRVNGVLRQEISRVLATELRDPRIPVVVSVTQVDASADLRHAKVYISVLGDDAEKRLTIRALKSAAGFVHRNLRRSLSLKSVPTLRFVLDESIETGNHILGLIDEAIAEAGPPSEA
jgi:ribosome-binding factor A